MTIDTSTADKSFVPTDYKAAMMYHSDRCDALAAERDAAVAALTQSRAETAAAYERAGKACYEIAGNTKDFGREHRRAAGQCGAMVRALATPDQSAALDAVKAEAHADGMRKAHNGIEIWITGRNSEGKFWLHLKEPSGKSGGINLGNPSGMIITALLTAAAIPKGGA